MIVSTGIDLVEIARFENLSPEIRNGFLARVFTPAELVLAEDSSQFLAGRFAAKESVAKALGCGIGPVSWQEIEILRGDDQQPCLILKGSAAQVAKAKGFSQWSLSISHSGGLAVAVAVALGDAG